MHTALLWETRMGTNRGCACNSVPTSLAVPSLLAVTTRENSDLLPPLLHQYPPTSISRGTKSCCSVTVLGLSFPQKALHTGSWRARTFDSTTFASALGVCPVWANRNNPLTPPFVGVDVRSTPLWNSYIKRERYLSRDYLSLGSHILQ